MSFPNDSSKMVQTVFQPTRKKSAGVGSFWWKHLGGLLYDFLVICGCAIFIAVFCRVGSVRPCFSGNTGLLCAHNVHVPNFDAAQSY